MSHPFTNNHLITSADPHKRRGHEELVLRSIYREGTHAGDLLPDQCLANGEQVLPAHDLQWYGKEDRREWPQDQARQLAILYPSFGVPYFNICPRADVHWTGISF